MARRLEDGTLVDPLGGRADLERRILRTVSPRSFAEDPLRLVRGLRFVSQLDLDPNESTLAQMREEAASVSHVSGERIGGGLAADGLGELSKLLLGPHPAKALRLARDTGVLAQLLPELAPAIGFEQESRHHALTVDEHTFAVVQAAADLGMPLRVRLAALFHDVGKPHVAWRGTDGRLHYYAKPGVAPRGHAQVGAQLADQALRRLRYPNDLRRRVTRIVRAHMLDPGRGDALRARRLLARYGDELLIDLLDHKEADLRGKGGEPRDGDLEKLARFRAVVVGERDSPYRLARPGDRRRRPDRARVHARPRDRPRARGAARGGHHRSRAEHAGQPARAGQGGASVIHWDEPGYVVCFTTRVGGVSEGDYASLNLTAGTGDDPDRVERNRRIACERLGLDASALAFNRQVHSPTVHRARAGSRGDPGDGLWSDEPGLPMLAFAADCLPIAIARVDGTPRSRRPARRLARPQRGRGRGRRPRARRRARRRRRALRSGRAATRSGPRCRHSSTTI